MPSSKKIIQKNDTGESVLPYQVQRFPLQMSAVAREFVREQPLQQQGFKLDPNMAEQTGIAESERQAIDVQVEKKALEKLKSIQEESYQQAHELGLEEGREKAYQDFKERFESNLTALELLLKNIESLKSDLVDQNERSLIRLLFLFAAKVAKKEIQDHQELIFETVRECVHRAQEEDNLRVIVSVSDLEFLKEASSRSGRELNFLKRVQLEGSDEITSGGCIIENNYGQIDATLETRVQKLWELLESQMPSSKSSVKAS